MERQKYTPEERRLAARQSAMKYKKANQEQLNISMPMGHKAAYMELAEKRGVKLARMILNYLNGECEKEGIELVRMTKEELEAKKRDGN